MSSEDREAQEDELLALASIYDGDEFRKAESVQGGETRIDQMYFGFGVFFFFGSSYIHTYGII